MTNAKFINLVWDYYHANKRTMPWRDNPEPYWVLVSEVMLQQTQVSRMMPKFIEFMQVFPAIDDLADAELGDVLLLWSGLGYNRRAKYLRDAAKQIKTSHAGVVPRDVVALRALPGIGPNTAGAIVVYAYNQPAMFVETNIRAAYIHGFFQDKEDVSDAKIIEKLQKTLDTHNPREWYWALMDYGVYVKSQYANPTRQSKHYVVQSKFSGSRRQLRGKVLRQLLERSMTYAELHVAVEDDRLAEVMSALTQEGLVTKKNTVYRLGG